MFHKYSCTYDESFEDSYTIDYAVEKVFLTLTSGDYEDLFDAGIFYRIHVDPQVDLVKASFRTAIYLL